MTEYSIRANNSKIEAALTVAQALKRARVTARKQDLRRRNTKDPGRLHITTMGPL